MRQALEALTCCEAMDRNAEQQKTQAITALRTALKQAAQQAEPCVGKDPRCPCQDGDACHYKDCGSTKAWPVPQAEPVAREDFEKWAKSLPNYMDISRFEAGYSDCNTDYAWAAWKAALAPPQQQAEPSKWRDMVVVTLVREGINKHKARELADHFAAQQQAEPFAWAVQGITQMLRGEFAELDAKSKARRIGGTCVAYPLYTTPPAAQPERSYVDGIQDAITLLQDCRENSIDWLIDRLSDYKCAAERTIPAVQRPWVGLEAEDLAQIESDEFWQVGNHMAIAMAVEAKLKAKNV
jgi:hypothetical protein